MRRLQEEQKNNEFLMQSKSTTINALQTEIEELGKKLEAVTEDKKESSLQAEKVELQEMSLKHQMTRIANEREFYQNQVDSLTLELNNQSSELSNIRKEKAAQFVEMQSTIDEKDDIINKLQEELSTLKELTDKKDEHIDSLAKRIKEINDASVQFEVQYQAEIEEMKSLASHHSSAYEKEKKTNQQLLDTIEEMQKLLLDGQQAQQDLEETLTRATMESQKVIKFKDEVIKKLDDEITRLKAQAVAKIQEDLEEEVDHYFPTASATHKVFKSNMSLSQIYNEYIVLQDKLDASQIENNRLKEQLNQLIEEAEQKTPFIHQKVQESRKSLQTIRDLQIQLAKVTNEKDSLIEEKENLIQMTNYLNREIARLEQTSHDLALQVRSLIATVHEAKGYELARQENVPERETEESAANRIITQHLVTFDDITSLQVNNQRLIFSIRDLAAENERLVDQLKEKEQFSQQEMSKAFEEISKLTEERRRQAEMLSELMEAKSTLKSMAKSDESNRRSPGFNSDSSRMTMNETLVEMKESLRRIQAEATANKADYEQKMKELNEDISHYRQELALVQTEKAKTESESEYIQEKMKLLQANFELTKKENCKLVESNSKLSRKLAKSEGNLAVLRKEISEIKGTRDKLEANILALQSERDLLRNNEKLLTQERDNLNKDYQEKSKLISTLQKIQDNFARLESESSKGVYLQLEKLEKEATYFKGKLVEEEQKAKNLVQAHSKQIADLHQKIDFELKKNAELREAIVLTESRLHVVESELKVIKSNFEQDRARSKDELRDNPEQLKKIREMEDKWSKAEAMVKELREENEQLKNKVNEKEEKTKKLALQARSRIAALTQQKKALEAEKEAFLKRITELETLVSQAESQTNQNKLLTKRLEETEKLARSASSQAKTFKIENDNLNRMNAELREKVDTLEENAKKNSLRFKTLSSGSAIKLNRLKALEESQARMLAQQEQFEKFQAQLSSTQHSQSSTSSSTVPTGSSAASTSGFVGTSSVNVPTPSSSSSSSSTSSSTGLVRHPVLPQKQVPPAPKPTPRASIRPLSVSRLPPISRSTTSTPGHVAVVAVQPNTEESAQLVPQATVAPTVVAAPTPTAAAAAASSSEPIMSSSTSTSTSSIPLSSTAMSSSTPSPSPAASTPVNSSNNNQPPISSSEATPQLERLSRPAEVVPSTRDNQSSELRITSSQGNSNSNNTLNQEPSVTTSDESGETSRQGLKRQRESPSPSTSRPQLQEDDGSKKVRLEEGNIVDQEIMYDTQQDILTHEQDDFVDESKESEVNESSPDQLPVVASQEVQQENEYQQEEYIRK